MDEIQISKNDLFDILVLYDQDKYEANPCSKDSFCDYVFNLYYRERLNPEEVKPIGVKFARKVAIIGTNNPQVFDLCDSPNSTNK